MRVIATLLSAISIVGCSSKSADDAIADAGGSDGGADAGLACPASGVGKGPWALAMARTTMKVRWEACRAGATNGIAFVPESGGAEATAPSVETAVVLTEEHTAPLNMSL